MITKLLLNLFGFVRISVKGSTIERFLNICIKNEIRLFKIERKDEVCMYASVRIKDFYRLRRYMGRTGCKVHIINRFGLPFFIFRFRKRYALWSGFFVALLVFFALTSCVWVIDIETSGDIDINRLRESLNNAGIYTGVPIFKVDETKSASEIRFEMADVLDYISVSRLGNRIIVRAINEQDAPKIQDDKSITGIVATYDGVIKNINVKEGYPLVKVGDAVVKGDKLVTALTPPTTEEGLGSIGHSIAQITASTRRTEKSISTINYMQKRYTGKQKTQFAIVIGNLRINLYFGTGISGAQYEKTIKETQLHIGEGTYFPIKIIRQDYKQYETIEVNYTKKEIQDIMQENAKKRIKNKMKSGKIDDIAFECEIKNGAVILKTVAHCTEDIAEQISEEGILYETFPQTE